MTTLTDKQKYWVEALCMYEVNATVELRTNGLTAYYDECIWMVAYYKKKLGLHVPDYYQVAVDRHEAREAA